MRIVWVKMGGLWPATTGGRVRSLNTISELARGHQVTVITTHNHGDDPDGLKQQLSSCARVVSVPCFELFMKQTDEYRRAIVGDARVKIGIEAAVRQGWDAIIGSNGIFIGMNSFGASAPYKELYKKFGITAETVAGAALAKLGKT